MKRNADNFVDFQQRATEFSVGDIVVPFGMLESQSGRVTAVWPAIGMADVEMQTGSKRYPVEELQKFVDGNASPTHDNSSPTLDVVSVPGGPDVSRVAFAAHRKALYWAGKDRQYKMTRSELGGGKPCCPRCDDHPDLKRAIYKTREGANTRLLGCPSCMFLIKEDDILNHPSAVAKAEVEMLGD